VVRSAAAPSSDRGAPITFEVMRSDDLEAVVALEKRAFRDPWPATMFRRELRLPHSKIVLARAPGGDVLGYVCRWIVGDHMEIQNIAVDPRWRRRSIARQLLARMIEEAKAAHVARAMLEVRIGNRAAIALYREFGFEPNGRRARYYDDGEDALLMELRFERA
jgi:[ribosomal protein S18]-alanine N-acetyltransferase